MVEIAIIGNGSHGRMLKAIFKDQADFFMPDDLPDNLFVCIGIGNVPEIGKSDLKTRRKLFEQYDGRLVGICHPTAVVIGEVDSSCQVMATAVINSNARVMHNVIINTGAIIEHDCVIGPHCHIAPGATVLGGVTIGEETHVGANSVILQGKRIGKGCVIGAGSVVTDSMEDYETWIGSKLYE